MRATYGFRILFFFAILAVLQTRAAQATLLEVTIDTSSLTGTPAQLAFDLIDGDGVANNMATLVSFNRDGSPASLDPGLIVGDVMGNLPGPVAIKDTFFFNEYLQPLILGSFITFSVELTENYTGGLFPDQFSFFILDEFGDLPIVLTDDPLDTHALLAFDITGEDVGDLQVFGALTGTDASWSAKATVPEPHAIWLVSIGFIICFSYRLRTVLNGCSYSAFIRQHVRSQTGPQTNLVQIALQLRCER